MMSNSRRKNTNIYEYRRKYGDRNDKKGINHCIGKDVRPNTIEFLSSSHS